MYNTSTDFASNIKKRLEKIGDSVESSESSCRIGSIKDMKEALAEAGVGAGINDGVEGGVRVSARVGSLKKSIEI